MQYNTLIALLEDIREELHASNDLYKDDVSKLVNTYQAEIFRSHQCGDKYFVEAFQLAKIMLDLANWGKK